MVKRFDARRPTRTLPECNDRPDRWFRFVSMRTNEATTDEVFDQLLEFASEYKDPPDGGVGNESHVLTTQSKDRFMLVSFRGDLEEWDRLIQSFVVRTNRQVARIQDGHVLVSGTIALNRCELHEVIEPIRDEKGSGLINDEA